MATYSTQAIETGLKLGLSVLGSFAMGTFVLNNVGETMLCNRSWQQQLMFVVELLYLQMNKC